MVRSLSPHLEIAERIVRRQASSLAKCEARTEDCAIEINAAENSRCCAMWPFSHWLSQLLGARLIDEELSESSAFGAGSRHLHSRFRGRQAELSEDG
jgi:hypothetical protein